jgi:hypothetical protein
VALFGRKTPLQLTVEPAIVTGGEEIICRVDVGEIDAKVQGGRIELGYENTYVEDQDSDGTTTIWRSGHGSTSRTTEWVPVQMVPMLAGHPAPGQQIVRLRLPKDAPPTVADIVEWQVQAIIDRRRGLDAWAEARLVVQAAPGVLAHRTRTPAESSTEIPITVELATRELRPGEILTGTVTANPTVEQDTRGLRVQLVSERPEQDGIVERNIEAVVTLTGEAELRPGLSIFSAFQIAIPADAAPCWDAKYNSLHWYLEAVADLPMMRDEVTRIELLVTHGPKELDDGVNEPPLR